MQDKPPNYTHPRMGKMAAIVHLWGTKAEKTYLCRDLLTRSTSELPVMNQSSDTSEILSLALQQKGFADELSLVAEENASVEKLFSFQLQRYTYPQAWSVEEVGVVYFQPKTKKTSTAIELKYCVLGNQYCNNPACKNSGCALNNHKKGSSKIPVVDVINISFQPGLLDMLGQHELASLFEDKLKGPLVRRISPCTKSKLALEQMVHHPYDGLLRNIFLQSKAMELMIYSSDQFIKNNHEDKFGCRFLTHDEDRMKIVKARDILLAHLDSPITIKELARKVAMNECYLKKGFKAMFGTTVYDFFQKERMERARYLLNEKGFPVSEVALKMGYSCISHFSTAFKKHTGIKPCELLR